MRNSEEVGKKWNIFDIFVAFNLNSNETEILSWTTDFVMFFSLRVGLNVWRFYRRRMGKILQQFSSSNWKFAGGRGNLRQTAFPVYLF